MAGDNKMWIMILFMVISFVFKFLKKKRKESTENSESIDKTTTGGVSFGLNEMIREFEKKYMPVEPEIKPSKSYKVDKGEDLLEVGLNSTQNRFSKNESLGEEVLNTKLKKPFVGSVVDYSGDDKGQEGLDLKQMVISNAILERPTY